MSRPIRRLYRRLRYGEPIVVVSGLPRSGTSMLMRMLESGGLPVLTDGQRTADEDNPRGYFEVERIKNLARESDASWLAGARGRAVKVISYLLKSLPAQLNYRVLFIRRDLDEVLASQEKMLARRGQKDNVPAQRMRELFEKDTASAWALLTREPRFDALEVHYAVVLAHPREEARRIARFLGGALDVEAMAAAVDRGLYRNRSEAEPAAEAPPTRP